jgi:DNA-binding GntR family transcriptional regulator
VGMRAGGRLRYEQVIQRVERLIADRDMQPGDLLPTNQELARTAGVSLITVRRALDELERSGRVRRHQGVGTFVAGGRILSEPARRGTLLATLESARDAKVTTRLVEVARGIAGPTVSGVLEVDPDEPVWEIVRLRLIRGRPAILERAVLPVRLVPRLDRRGLAAGRSLYGFLESEYGLRDDSEEQYLEVSSPAPAERTHLELTGRDRVVRIRGVSLTEDGTAFDSFQQAYPAGDFVFYISGRAARHVLRASDARDWGIERRQSAGASGRSR